MRNDEDARLEPAPIEDVGRVDDEALVQRERELAGVAERALRCGLLRLRRFLIGRVGRGGVEREEGGEDRRD